VVDGFVPAEVALSEPEPSGRAGIWRLTFRKH